ncbi:MAG: metal ABC transporter permease [Myxococcales bacterium]|nr:metal ABC transporter permease [Myxococcales bacterium]
MDGALLWSDLWAARELFAAPIACAAAAGAGLGFLSVFIVLKRMVFISATVSQCAGLGVAFAFWIELFLGMHLPPAVIASLVAIAATLLCAIDPKRVGLTREALLGLIYALSASLAVLLSARLAQEAHEVQAILFGSAVLVRDLDVWLVSSLGAIILLLGTWTYRGLTFALFDETAARAQGLAVLAIKGALLIAIGAMIGISARALGALPVFALSTLPAVAALRWRLPLRGVLIAASFIGVFDGVGGYLLALRFDLPVGATQATLAGFVALASIAIWTLWARWRRLRRFSISPVPCPELRNPCGSSSSSLP